MFPNIVKVKIKMLFQIFNKFSCQNNNKKTLKLVGNRDQ